MISYMISRITPLVSFTRPFFVQMLFVSDCLNIEMVWNDQTKYLVVSFTCYSARIIGQDSIESVCIVYRVLYSKHYCKALYNAFTGFVTPIIRVELKAEFRDRNFFRFFKEEYSGSLLYLSEINKHFAYFI